MTLMDKKRFDYLTNLVENYPRLATQEDLDALEPYRAKRAIFLAAGFGSRLTPITLNTPKPLVRVNGISIIETLIIACLKAGIEEIYIVRGHLAEEFDVLLHKYPRIHFIENPDYAKANNISSAIAVVNHDASLFENAYVLEADLLVTNPKIIHKYHYESDVLGIWMEHSNDWVLVPTPSDKYVAEEKVGGDHCYQMVGIYYWNQRDGARLSADLKRVYDSPGGHDRYWETIPNQVCRGQYSIKIVPCCQADVVEIDTFDELKAIDPSYR